MHGRTDTPTEMSAEAHCWSLIVFPADSERSDGVTSRYKAN